MVRKVPTEEEKASQLRFDNFLRDLPKDVFLRSPALKEDLKLEVMSLLDAGQDKDALAKVTEYYLGNRYVLLRDREFPASRYLRVPRFSKKTTDAFGAEVDDEKAQAILRQEYKVTGGLPFDLRAPSQVRILAQSRPFHEWRLFKATFDVQERVYSLTNKKFEAMTWPANEKEETFKTWFADNGIPYPDGLSPRLLKLVVENAKSLYKAVITKVENRNSKSQSTYEKRLDSAQKYGKTLPERPIPESPFREDGHLKHRPGPNPSLYCDRDMDPGVISNIQDFKMTVITYAHGKRRTYEVQGQEGLTLERLEGYARDEEAALLPEKPVDRTLIPKGMPGYVPLFQRHLLSNKKTRRRRRGWGPASTPEEAVESLRRKDQSALLVLLQLKSSDPEGSKKKVMEDWVILDARGLLRNARYRCLLPPEASLKDLMGLFTNAPVIDPGVRFVRDKCQVCEDANACTHSMPARMELKSEPKVRYMYREGVLPVASLETSKRKGGPSFFRGLQGLDSKNRKSVALIALDLGQTNPVAGRISRLNIGDDGIQAESLDTFFLQDLEGPSLYNGKDGLLDKYRKDYTRMRLDNRRLALSRLSAEQQVEVENADSLMSPLAKASVCRALNLDPREIEWSAMTPNSKILSNAFLAKGGDRSVVYYTTRKKGAKVGKEYLRTDKTWAQNHKPRISKETSKALNDNLRAIEKSSEEFRRFSIFQREVIQRSINLILSRAKKYSQCEVLVLAIEDLNIGMMHGKGKYLGGWEGFFSQKQENRWFIRPFHRELSKLPLNRGIPVLEVNPAFTSQTCPNPECHYCDRDNRNGETFKCLSCPSPPLHADKDVATHNITRVAIEGKSLPPPLGTSRKSKVPKKSVPSEGPVDQKVSKDSPKKLRAKAPLENHLASTSNS